MERRIVVTQRDCPARLVPVGTPITIAKDTFVTITQALGGSYTVTVNGNMARVDGTDADALGMEALELRFAEHPGDGISEEQVYQALETEDQLGDMIRRLTELASRDEHLELLHRRSAFVEALSPGARSFGQRGAA